MRILLVRTGGPVAPAPPETHQDLSHWYGDEQVEVDIVRTRRGEPLPPPDDYDGFVVSGSPCSLTQIEPWMETTTRYVRDVVDRGKQLLGVCFGHQMIGLAFGGRVIKNPLGRVMGTVRITLTPEGARDPLFRGMGPELAVQTTHQDIIVECGSEVICMATHPTAELQAIRVGSNCRGIQFHPELDDRRLRKLALQRVEALDAEGVAKGLAPGEGSRRVLDAITPSTDGRTVLRNFLDIVRGASGRVSESAVS